MRCFLIAGAMFASGAWNAGAQVPYPPLLTTKSCVEFNRSISVQIGEGRLAHAEDAVAKALAGKEGVLDEPCAWLLLQTAANIAELQGQFLAAEDFAGRSFRIADRLFPATDARRLPSLQLLWSLKSQAGNRAQARRMFEAIAQLRLYRPQDRAMAHGTAAAELQLEGKFAASEVEYREALLAGEEAGRGQTANQAIVLSALGSLYLAQNRLRDSELTLEQAFALVRSAPDAVPSDYISIIHSRAILRARQKQWSAAAEDLASVIALTAKQRLDPAQMKALLESHAYALRKAHRRAEARVIESRAAVIHEVTLAKALIDVSELRVEDRSRRRP